MHADAHFFFQLEFNNFDQLKNIMPGAGVIHTARLIEPGSIDDNLMGEHN